MYNDCFTNTNERKKAICVGDARVQKKQTGFIEKFIEIIEEYKKKRKAEVNAKQFLDDYLKRIRKSLRQVIVDYLRALPLNINVEVNGITYKLVHAAPVEEYVCESKYKNAVHFAVWKRLELDYPLPKEYTLIFGHTTTKHFQDRSPMEIWRGNRRICIDCGSGYPEDGPDSEYGRLACLRLDDGKVFYSEEECHGH